MIKKILIMSSILFVGYTIFIYTCKPSHINQNMWQANMVRMQDYQYGKHAVKHVVVGTSMADQAFLVDAPEDYYNLTMVGGNPYDGLEIISRTKPLPRSILIETNNYDSYTISDMVKTSCLPELLIIKRYIPSLQERYQPVSIIMPLLVNIFNALTTVFSPFLETINSSPRQGDAGSKVPPKVQKEVLENRDKTLRKPVQDKMLKSALTHLGSYVDYFKKNNVRIIFFEMPVAQSLCGTPRAEQMRAAIRERFAPGTYDYIAMPDCGTYNAPDGIHLDTASALRYKKYLLNEINKLPSR